MKQMSNNPTKLKFIIEGNSDPTIDVDGNPWTLHAVMIRLQQFKKEFHNLSKSRSNRNIIYNRERFSVYLRDEAAKGMMSKELYSVYKPVYELANEVAMLYITKNTNS